MAESDSHKAFDAGKQPLCLRGTMASRAVTELIQLVVYLRGQKRGTDMSVC